MPVLAPTPLEDFTSRLFQAHSVDESVAKTVAKSLVLSNLKGHDSHGIIRIIEYLDWMERGWIVPSSKIEILKDRGAILMIDGHWGFGQVVGRQATALAIAKAQKEGVCVLTIRHSGHLGRVGEWMEMAAEAGLVAFSFTNTHGGGVLVAPHGGCERRLSANPLGGGAPVPDGPDLIMDFATSIIAEGKIKVARDKGEDLPPGCIVNGQGDPSTSPTEYYSSPPGALLPFAGHKGYALAMFAEIFSGVLSGGSCSKSGVDRVANTFCGFFLEPAAFVSKSFYDSETSELAKWVKSCRPARGAKSVLLPGEPESAEHLRRSREGIPIPAITWDKLAAIAQEVHVPLPQISPTTV